MSYLVVILPLGTSRHRKSDLSPDPRSETSELVNERDAGKESQARLRERQK